MAFKMAEDQKSNRIMNLIRNHPHNSKCINCNVPYPQYVCTTFSTFVCSTCSSIHGELGHEVKALSNGNFTAEEITSLKTGGNERARKLFLRKWDTKKGSPPSPCDVSGIRKFINNVYVQKKYTDEGHITKQRQKILEFSQKGSRKQALSLQSIRDALPHITPRDSVASGTYTDHDQPSVVELFSGHRLIPRSPFADGSPKASIIVRHEEPVQEAIDYCSYNHLAESALCKLNAEVGTEFKFVKVIDMGGTLLGSKEYIHMNFNAVDECHVADDGDDGALPVMMFYAEFFVVKNSVTKEWECDNKETRCALIEQVDTPNPLGGRCTRCTDSSVNHPGPSWGYRVVCGNGFESSPFMGYHNFSVLQSVRFEDSWEDSFNDSREMFHSCATQALHYFNINQKSNFCLARVLAGVSIFCEFEKLAHLNFLAQRPGKSKEAVLFFAVAIVPMLSYQRLDEWDPSIEKFIRVEGCCLLREADTRSIFGRVCMFCLNRVKHPGHKDGYEIAAGDRFEGYQFMEIGKGIY